jgi:hypothetical protein
LIGRLRTCALRVERGREIETRLMVERICSQLLLELGHRTDRLGLLGKVDRSLHRLDRGVIALRFRHHSKRLLGLLDGVRRDVAFRQPGKGGDIGGVEAQYLAAASPSANTASASCRISAMFGSPGAVMPLVSLSMKALIWLSGTAPMKPSAGWPPTNAITAGIDWMPIWPGMVGCSSMFILTSLTLPLAARTAFSSTGVSCRQGPHQGAQKSISTGWRFDSSMTSLTKVWVVVSLIRSGAACGAGPPPCSTIVTVILA